MLYSERTESCRLVRGAREAAAEYIPELCTEGSVGCSGVTSVISRQSIVVFYKSTVLTEAADASLL